MPPKVTDSLPEPGTLRPLDSTDLPPADPPRWPEYPAPSMNPYPPDVPPKTLMSLAEWTVKLTKQNQDRPPPGTAPDNRAVNTYPITDPKNPSSQLSYRGAGEPVAGNIDIPGSTEFGADTVPGLNKGSRKLGDMTSRSGNEYLSKAQTGQAVDRGSGVKDAQLEPQLDKYTTGVLAVNRWAVNTYRSSNDNLVIHGTSYNRGAIANVGDVLTTRAGAEMGSSNDGYDAGKPNSEANAILPGWTQMQLKRVSFGQFDANDALNNGAGGPKEENVAPEGSWGTMNNPLDPYSGMSAFGMAALVIALFLATAAIIYVFTQLLGIIVKSGNDTADPTSMKESGGRYRLGQWGPKRSSGSSNAFPPIPMDSALVANLLGLRTTMYEWKKCVEAGFMRFYGSEEKSMSSLVSLNPGAVLDSLSRALESPGFYSVVSRAIMRGGVQIVDSLKDIFSSPNIMSGVKNLISFFEVVKASKFIAALNTFAIVGETVWKTDDAKAMEGKLGANRYSAMDDDENKIASNTKNRLKLGTGQSTKLAWSSNRAISLLRTPNIMRSTLLQGVVSSGPASLLGVPNEPLSRTIYARNDGRLPSDVVEYIEAVLDAEYVPFYFHDLRTNEVISFHAFMASITDDYAANWENVDSPGRIDPVKIYKNTIRKIGMSFHVVATSSADFDEMWIKINKLVTLVYPQYTAGRIVQDSADNPKNRFTLPFSQLPGASPLVRIRLGDLFRSNYSRFALARLFGLGYKYSEDAGAEDDLKVDGTSFLTKKNPVSDTKLKRIMEWANDPDAVKDDVRFLVPMKVLIHTGIDPTNGDIATNPSRKRSIYSILAAGERGGFNALVKITRSYKTNDGGTKLIVNVDQTRASKLLGPEEKKMNDSLQTWMAATGFMIDPECLILPASEQSRYVTDADDPNAASKNSAFDDFMKPENNALSRAFKETGGKGLAGVIESMNFDWYNQVTWETLPGLKAPKMCKVTVSFSPIHDIPPGLDHVGYNRAPMYPVGSSDGESLTTRAKRKLSPDEFAEALSESPMISSDVSTKNDKGV